MKEMTEALSVIWLVILGMGAVSVVIIIIFGIIQAVLDRVAAIIADWVYPTKAAYFVSVERLPTIKDANPAGEVMVWSESGGSVWGVAQYSEAFRYKFWMPLSAPKKSEAADQWCPQ